MDRQLSKAWRQLDYSQIPNGQPFYSGVTNSWVWVLNHFVPTNMGTIRLHGGKNLCQLMVSDFQMYFFAFLKDTIGMSIKLSYWNYFQQGWMGPFSEYCDSSKTYDILFTLLDVMIELSTSSSPILLLRGGRQTLGFNLWLTPYMSTNILIGG